MFDWVVVLVHYEVFWDIDAITSREGTEVSIESFIDGWFKSKSWPSSIGVGMCVTYDEAYP